LIVRHMCDDGESSSQALFGLTEMRATMSRNGSKLTDMFGSNE